MPRTFVTFEDLYQEVAELAREHAVNSQEEWNELVDEVVEGYVDMGEMNPDQDTEGYKTSLSPLWARFKNESQEEEAGPEEDIATDSYLKNPHDEFDTVENFSDTVKKEEEGF